jgi:hypothetical protein
MRTAGVLMFAVLLALGLVAFVVSAAAAPMYRHRGG